MKAIASTLKTVINTVNKRPVLLAWAINIVALAAVLLGFVDANALLQTGVEDADRFIEFFSK